ncbi:hypothetical protein [Dyella monticola]|uniref:hypothetical protein n=1 Tax=Dyella monticola TaxID=1927958 RepID=UPI001E4AF3F9|nr:hypothetical protein [Dyella monticola]
MYTPRFIRCSPLWNDEQGAKLYTISVMNAPVDMGPFLDRLVVVKADRDIDWAGTAHFAIFHQGIAFPYCVLCWWGNDNELFTSVSVRVGKGWVERPERYSFCLYDMEVFWVERTVYIETMYGEHPDLLAYRQALRQDWLSPSQPDSVPGKHMT